LLLHYWFPIALGWSLVLVVHQATGRPIENTGFQVYLLGIFAAYSLDRLLDNSNRSQPYWMRVALLCGFVFSTLIGVVLALRLSIQTFSALVVFSLITISYVWVKRFPFVKGLLVAIVWGWASIALPFSNEHWFAWQFWTTQVSLPIVTLMMCNVILCDFKDVNTDQKSGVKSLPAMFGMQKTAMIVSILLAAAAVISYHENRMGLVISSVLLLLLARFPRFLSMKAIGPLSVDLSMVLPGVLIAFRWIS